MGIRTVELFAGVGGFRLGLERTNLPYETCWWNQWEPKTRVQHAWNCYLEHFHDGDPSAAPPGSNSDICRVDASSIPEHDLLVGGFPCQDYSVATTLDKAGGLRGKKGVLWWEINRLIAERKHKPRYLLLENVDRLLKSPASKRGRDFGVVLACLRDLGYAVEWRVVNAAEYGNPQRRRRTFIFAARLETGIGKHMVKSAAISNYLLSDGIFAQAFPTSFIQMTVKPEDADGVLAKDVRKVSADFEFPFQNAGVMVHGSFWTKKVAASREPTAFLSQCIEDTDVPAKYFLDKDREGAWRKAKGPKREPRTAKNGHTYFYAEGGMQFPDRLESPGRTVLTSEGNKTPNRSTHVIVDPRTKELRFLMPLEVERLMGFDDNWTASLPERWRYFTMGNALVVPVVMRFGSKLADWIRQYEPKKISERLLGETNRAHRIALTGR